MPDSCHKPRRAAAALTTLACLGAADVGAETCRWTGTWNMGQWGMVSLVQEGRRVSGGYTGAGGGLITGTASGATLSGTWRALGQARPDGEIEWTMTRDCQSYSGRWKHRDAPAWDDSTLHGTRTSDQPTPVSLPRLEKR